MSGETSIARFDLNTGEQMARACDMSDFNTHVFKMGCSGLGKDCSQLLEFAALLSQSVSKCTLE